MLFSQIRFRRGTPQPEVMNSWELEVYPAVLRSFAGFLAENEFQPELVCDVGCRNWSYLEAMVAAFPKARRFVGVEVEGSRLYRDLYRRRDRAFANARRWSNDARTCDFIEADFRSFTFPKDVQRVLVTLFFPFVSKDPCVRWGLPEEYSNYEQLLIPVKGFTGDIFVTSCHQGKWERDLAIEAYLKIGYAIRFEQLLEVSEHPYPLYLIGASPEHQRAADPTIGSSL